MKTLASLILTLLSGTVLIEEIIPHIVTSCVPVFNEAIGWQETTVQTAEYLELGCAKEARIQWNKNKAVAIERIESFKSLKQELQ